VTALWSAQDLLEATGGMMPVHFDAIGASIDSRSMQPGDLFIALRGEAGDGHAFVFDALRKGAAGAMVHQDIAGADRLLRVDDTLGALARLGGYARARFTGRMIAVTGSVGKTTTKEMLRRILAATGPTHAAVASYNNHWGLPLTLARLAPEAQFCVAEIGMNHAGEIAPLARLARPHVALITTVEKAHIGYLGSLAAIAAEKASLLQGLEPDGVAVLPVDSPMFATLRAAAANHRLISFGSTADAQVRLRAAVSDADGTDLEVSINGTVADLRIEAPGRHMAMNALAALSVAVALGIEPRHAARALAGFAAMVGRGLRREIAVPGGSALLLDESYNGNGASMRAALAVLKLQPARRRVAVLGDMLELGDQGPAEHLALVEPVTAAADLLFACGKLSRRLFEAVPTSMRGAYAEDSAGLAPIAAQAVQPGDVILVKGSLGSKMKRVVEALDALGSAG
jgi:UDP-N-acetylmuramoyl-tripeptide--D-alanyl-D-alanine ligase